MNLFPENAAVINWKYANRPFNMTLMGLKVGLFLTRIGWFHGARSKGLDYFYQNRSDGNIGFFHESIILAGAFTPGDAYRLGI
jgi:hypothetical protein